MRKCEHCQCDMNSGHVMYDSEFYLCEKCFNKFYTLEMANEMFEKELQYYTEWEDTDND